MKFVATLAIVLPSATTAFAFTPSKAGRVSTSLDASIVYFSTSTGNCQTVGEYISEAAGCSLEDIGDASTSEVLGYDSLIVGAPTWNTGADDHRSGTAWDDFLYETLPDMDLAGKKVAVYGVGDQQSYMDNYCDAAGELYDVFEAKGCKMFGLTSTDGYEHQESKADRDGTFVGLMCDEDNWNDQSEGKAKDWVDQLKTEGFF